MLKTNQSWWSHLSFPEYPDRNFGRLRTLIFQKVYKNSQHQHDAIWRLADHDTILSSCSRKNKLGWHFVRVDWVEKQVLANLHTTLNLIAERQELSSPTLWSFQSTKEQPLRLTSWIFLLQDYSLSILKVILKLIYLNILTLIILSIAGLIINLKTTDFYKMLKN